MIVVYHINNKITKVISDGNKVLSFNENDTIALGLMELAFQYPKSKIVWCNQDYEEYLNLNSIIEVFHHDKMMISYNPEEVTFLSEKIGYVDETPFIKINKKVTFPTWQMSSLVGGVHASVLREINRKIKLDYDFDYYLNSIAKICMPLGLLCYSEPKLLLGTKIHIKRKPVSNTVLFKFVKQHYRAHWVFLLFLDIMVYEFKFPLIAFFYSIFFKNRNKNSINLDSIKVHSSLSTVGLGTIDVVIPTIGRKEYLFDVLKDLSKQKYLPGRVIIVEQNPNLGSSSELGYITTEAWPFEIKHIFIHQAGACNARNLALEEVKSEWIFMADDDIRFNDSFLEDAITHIKEMGLLAVTFACFGKEYGIDKKPKRAMQWVSFGSGCSIIKTPKKMIKYTSGFEFGYGEDSDYGMQLRNQGIDILYFPNPEILHLKAPIGGFRTKPILAWANDTIEPKPSPTIMLYKKLHLTRQQVNGYKTILFFKFYKAQIIKNPIRYFFYFQKRWKQSEYWANELKNKE